METIRSHESQYTNFKENDDEVSRMVGYLETFVMLCSSAVEMKNFWKEEVLDALRSQGFQCNLAGIKSNGSVFPFFESIV